MSCFNNKAACPLISGNGLVPIACCPLTSKETTSLSITTAIRSKIIERSNRVMSSIASNGLVSVCKRLCRELYSDILLLSNRLFNSHNPPKEVMEAAPPSVLCRISDLNGDERFLRHCPLLGRKRPTNS